MVEKLTLDPDTVDASDMRLLLDLGISPEAISDAIHVAALFNLIDRVADGLGIEALPPDQAADGASFVVSEGY